MQGQTRIRRAALTLLCSWVLMFMALYDGFPILTNDTGTYITSGFTLHIPNDRPVFYGLFIRATSLGFSVWLTVLAQCLILADSFIYLLRKLIRHIPAAHIFMFACFISVCTIGGWYAGQLMPDIFVAILLLTTAGFLLFDHSWKRASYQVIIIILCSLVHNSNLIALLLFALITFTASFIFRKWFFGKKKLIVLISLSFASWIIMGCSNWIGGNGFSGSKFTHVFVMGKLVESGVLKTYLDKACPTKNYKICPYKDSLPPVAWEFHWDAASPLQKTGGWEANRTEYKAIISDIFSRPKYYPYMAYKGVEATARQLTLFNIDGSYRLPWMKFDAGTPPYEAVSKYFPHELSQLKSSQQNQKTLDIAFFDNLFLIVIVASVILFLFLFPSLQPLRREILSLLFIFFCFILLNAFVTAILSSVNSRYNSRVVWIIPFFCAVYIYRFFARPVVNGDNG